MPATFRTTAASGVVGAAARLNVAAIKRPVAVMKIVSSANRNVLNWRAFVLASRYSSRTRSDSMVSLPRLRSGSSPASAIEAPVSAADAAGGCRSA